VADSARSPEEIRLQLTSEREQLTGALAQLREEVKSARRIPLIVGGVVLAGVATVVAIRKVRD
jgi:hypothetical protein